MSEARYITEPRFHEAPGVSISAVVRPAEQSREIEVVVVFNRPAGQIPMTAGEVDAEMADRQGAAIPVTSRPQGTLAEAGGMGVSVNAPFRFRPEGRVPAELKVRYRGATYGFRLREGS